MKNNNNNKKTLNSINEHEHVDKDLGVMLHDCKYMILHNIIIINHVMMKKRQ